MQPRCQREKPAISARRRARGGELAKRASFARAGARGGPKLASPRGARAVGFTHARSRDLRRSPIGTPSARADHNQVFARFIQ
jgi:hypothetical protein